MMRRLAPVRSGLLGSLVLGLLAAALAACTVTFQPSAPRPMPLSEPQAVEGNPAEGMSFLASSGRIEPGVPYELEVFSHCGFTAITFDVDGSFWDPVGRVDAGSANPPIGIDNPTDVGILVLTAPDEATWTSAKGVDVRLVRGGPGPRVGLPCD